MSENSNISYTINNNNSNNNIIINSYINKPPTEHNSQESLSTLKKENLSLIEQISKLNDTLINLNTKLTTYEIDKNKLLLSSHKKDSDLKEIKEKLSKIKIEIDEMKQKMPKKINKINEFQNRTYNPI